MPQVCRVCTSEHRPEIDLALAKGLPCTEIARKYPPLTKDSVYRHKNSGHVPKAVIENFLRELAGGGDDLEALERDQRNGLLVRLRRQQVLLDEMLEKARKQDLFGVAVQISHCLHRNYEMVGKYLDLFARHDRSITHTHVLLGDPDYLALRSGLIAIARKHRTVRDEILDLLERIERERPYVTPAPNGASRVLDGRAVVPAVIEGPRGRDAGD
jgi:hypothetical protein